jgi:hypothetical protein
MPFFQDKMWVLKTKFLTKLDVCCQNCSGNKAVKFGRSTCLHWDYSFTKKSFISEGNRLCDLCLFDME